MTPQEQEMIGGLIDRVQKTQLAEKDMDAEQMLQQGLGRNPDALYILAQTVLVQKYALEQAQTQLDQAKAQIEQMQQHPEPKHATSFLGSLLGRNEAVVPPPPPPHPAAPPPPPRRDEPRERAPPPFGGERRLDRRPRPGERFAVGGPDLVHLHEEAFDRFRLRDCPVLPARAGAGS